MALPIDDFIELDSVYRGDYVDSPMHQEDLMAEVVRFEDKVKEALAAVMKHAVAGHDRDGASYNTFCNDAEHALEILRAEGIRPMNEAVVERYLDSGVS